nr:MAG TPA: hypothetical protein [Caudoviricetes sp.]
MLKYPSFKLNKGPSLSISALGWAFFLFHILHGLFNTIMSTNHYLAC